CTAIRSRDTSAERINHHLLDQTSRKIGHAIRQHLTHGGRTVKRLAVRQRAGGVDRELSILLAPFANRIVVLERKAEWIHFGMASRTDGVRAMLFHLLAKRQH